MLLIFLIIFNNPIYLMEFLNDSWVFPFIGSVFTATFISVMLFCISIFVHSILQKPSERGIKFYAPKILLNGVLWLLSVAFFTFTSVESETDPTYAQDATKISKAFLYVEYTWFGLMGIWGVQILFYVVRIFSAFKRFKFRGVTTKFLALVILTGLVLLVSFLPKKKKKKKTSLFFFIFRNFRSLHKQIINQNQNPKDRLYRPDRSRAFPVLHDLGHLHHLQSPLQLLCLFLCFHVHSDKETRRRSRRSAKRNQGNGGEGARGGRCRIAFEFYSPSP